MPSGYNFYIGTIIIAVINLLNSKISLCSYLLSIIYYPRDFITFTARGQLVLLAGKTFWIVLYKKKLSSRWSSRMGKINAQLDNLPGALPLIKTQIIKW